MNTRPTPETEKLYKLAIYDLPYDTNYRTNYQTWQTVGLLKSHMERFERERDEAREKLEAERALADRLALQLNPLLIFTWRQLPPTKAELAFYAWEEARQSLTPNEPISK